MTSTEPQPVIPSEARDLLFLRANAIFLSSPNKSLRQIPHSRYNREADNYAKAPLRRLFHFQARFDPGQTPSDESRPIQKSLIMNDLRTLKMSLPANHSFSSACALFQKQGGVYPKASHFRTPSSSPSVFQTACLRGGSRQTLAAKPSTSCRRRRTAARNAESPPVGRRSIFTCKKKAISFTLGPFHRNATTANAVYTSIPLHRTNFRETDR